MSGDKVVAIVGIAMALVLILANGRLRRMPMRSAAIMAAVWVGIIVVAAIVFAGFRR